MAGINSNLAGVARVVMEVDTGRFNADIAAAEQRYRATTGAMSDDAIRMSLAQDRLNRALSRFGPQSAAAQRATLGLRSAERQTASETRVLTRDAHAAGGALRRLGRDAEHAGVGAAVGSRAIHGLRSSLIFGGASFLSGFGVASALKAVRDAAIEQQASLGQLQAALRASGSGMSAYTGKVKEALEAQQRLGFSEQETAKSFTLALRATKSVEGATRLSSAAADVARGSGRNLAQSTLLVTRAYQGQSGSLRRVGIDIGKNVKGYEAVDRAQRKFAGAAVTYAGSAAGAQARLNVAVHTTEETIGKALLPTITGLNIRLADWLDNSRNQARIQRDVARASREVGAAVHGVADAYRLFAPGVRAVNGLLGGTEHSVKLLVEAFVGLKFAKYARDLGLVRGATVRAGAAATVTAGEYRGLEAAEASAGIASGGIATGIGKTGRAARIAGGSVGALARGLGTLGKIGGITVGIDILTTHHTTRAHGINRYSGLGGYENLANDVAGLYGFDWQHGPPKLPNPKADTGFRSADLGAGFRDANLSDPGGGRRNRPRRLSLTGQFNLATFRLAQAGLTAGTADDVAALRDQERILRAQIAQAKTLAAKTDLINQLTGVRGSLQQIADQAAQSARDAADKRRARAADARRKAQEAAQKRAEAHRRRQARIEAQRREAESRREGTVGSRLEGFRRRLIKAEATEGNNDDLAVLGAERRYLVSEIKNKELQLSFRRSLEHKRDSLDAQINRLRKKKSGLTDLSGRQQQAFIGELSGILGQFSSNVTAAGTPGRGPVQITINNNREKSAFAQLREARLAAAHIL